MRSKPLGESSRKQVWSCSAQRGRWKVGGILLAPFPLPRGMAKPAEETPQFPLLPGDKSGSWYLTRGTAHPGPAGIQVEGRPGSHRGGGGAWPGSATGGRRWGMAGPSGSSPATGLWLDKMKKFWSSAAQQYEYASHY